MSKHTQKTRRAMNHESVRVTDNNPDAEMAKTFGPYRIEYARREYSGWTFLDLNGEVCQ